MVLRVKITILGEPNVGKTSLVSKYCKDQFPSEYRTTLGADFSTKTLKYKGKTVEMVLWDIAGTTDFEIERMSDYYLEGSNGYLLVFDLTSIESFQKMKSWHDKAGRICGNIPFIILGNKNDLKEYIEVDTTNQDQNLEKNYNARIIKTSAKTGENVENAMKSLLKLIMG
jgi:small GTP-binding protein